MSKYFQRQKIPQSQNKRHSGRKHYSLQPIKKFSVCPKGKIKHISSQKSDEKSETIVR